MLPILLVNVLATGYRVVQAPGMTTVWGLLTAIALFLAALFGRVFALAAQDRLIRLEERMRLRELLPAELRGRVNDFTAEQLIALRFASDGEVGGAGGHGAARQRREARRDQEDGQAVAARRAARLTGRD